MTCSYDACVTALPPRNRTGMCQYHQTVVWKRKHKERVNAHNRRYNAAKPEVMRRSRAKWDEAHPYSRAERRAVRRARKAGQFVEKVYKSKVFRRDGGICGVCNEAVDPTNWHLDHIKALAVGGEHSYANTQVTHPICNLRKAAS